MSYWGAKVRAMAVNFTSSDWGDRGLRNVYPVIRVSYESGITPSPVEGDKNFPHICPRCGKESYVGLLEVTHRYIIDQDMCPARTE